MKKLCVLVLLLGSLFAVTSQAQWVEKQTFSLDNFKTFGGKTIEQVNIGWEAYGELNADKSNAILITHYFSGTSNAAGRYSESRPAGYWDAIIGPGKAIDTNRFYVISSDTLVNANVFDENVITTGPATLNPATGKPYGLDFPVVTIRDFVNVQKALLESLGITQLHAVIGPSMGSMQAIDWAVAYPDAVQRMVSVIGVGATDAWVAAALEQWAVPIKLDPAWRNGNYYDFGQPEAGLLSAVSFITQQAMHPRGFNQLNPEFKTIAEAPLNDISKPPSPVAWLQQRAKDRIKSMDANHVLYLIRASQLFIAGHSNNLKQNLTKMSAKSLFLPAKGDLLLYPQMAEDTHNLLLELGKRSSYAEIDGDFGHLDGLFNIGQKAATLKQFLESD